MIRKHRRSIALAGAVGLAAAALWTFTRTPLYEATTQIEVTGAPQEQITKQALFGPIDEKSEFATHKFHLTSERILDAAAASIDLETRLGGSGAGGRWIAKRLSVERVPDTRIFRITARAPEAALAADLANAVAAVYEKDDVDRRAADAKKKLAWLDEQMADVKGQVETSELALIQYMETANMDLVEVSSSPDSDGSPSDLTPSGSPVLRDLESELGRKSLQLDRERLDKTDANPDVKRLREEMSILDKRIGVERKRVTEENKKRIRYGMLRRDAELNRQLFHVLMKELKEVNLVGDDDGSRIEVLRTAVATEHTVYPKPAQHLALGLAAGLLFGIGLAFLQETLDRTLKSREEIERLLGLPVLGVVHRVGASRRTGSKAFLPKAADERFVLKLDGSGTWAPEVEDFRTLRTNLRFARPDGSNKTLLVTSTAPEEGKTTIATNLAVVMAQAGERVLLVDADLRRPAVHLALELENRRGLTNLLVEAGLADTDVVQATSAANLFVISAGPFAPNPPDILESARMRELLAQWRTRFDRVIIDSPPQTSVVDPSILAPLVDGVLLVVSSGRVDAERARLARRQLAASGARFYGCVVNYIQRGADPYSYGYAYKNEYYGNRPAGETATGNGSGDGNGNGNGEPAPADSESTAARSARPPS